MTRLFLAAGVAALAISAPALAKPGEGHGGGNPHGGGGQPQAQAPRGGGGGHGGGGPRFQAPGGGGQGGGPRFQAFQQRGGGGGQRMQMQRMQMQRFAQPREQHQQMRAERMQQSRGFERRQMQAQRFQQQRGFERRQMQVQRMQQQRGFERRQMQAQRQQIRGNQMRQAQNRAFQHQQQLRMQANNHAIERQQMRANRVQQVQQQAFARQQFDRSQVQDAQNARNAFAARNNQFRVNDDFSRAYYANNGRGLINGCPPGLWAKNNGCLPPGQAQKLLGAPLASVAGLAALSALPSNVSYLYPDTPDYYYRYGDGYLYQVNRSDNVIASLMPLMGGGYLPGQYLPAAYMDSYVPDDYGFNSFYPDYGDVCNRYGYGVVYEVDCGSGVVMNVIPLYAGGYGVGQVLPASYAYYNVPSQYRSMYYDTPDYNYWYAPGAIYQYDPHSSMITSVAALLSPGFTVGQPLPVGYDAYNVPYAYRATYYDTPNAWYRYSNGYIYQVDPTSQLVTAIVASLLT